MTVNSQDRYTEVISLLLELLETCLDGKPKLSDEKLRSAKTIVRMAREIIQYEEKFGDRP